MEHYCYIQVFVPDPIELARWLIRNGWRNLVVGPEQVNVWLRDNDTLEDAQELKKVIMSTIEHAYVVIHRTYEPPKNGIHGLAKSIRRNLEQENII